MLLLQGKPVADRVYNDIRKVLENNPSKPHLAVILVGSDPASQVYVSHKQKACAALGFKSTLVQVPDNVTSEQLAARIKDLNSRDDVDAILLQLPLPKQFDARAMTNLISPEKDADSLTYTSMGRLVGGEQIATSCTPAGIIEILKHYQIPLSGKRVLVVGRSLIVGLPMFHLLTQQDATVTVAHSKTENLKAMLKDFPIVIMAVGKPHFVKATDFQEKAVVIDVGIHRTEKGLIGDVDPEGSTDHLYAMTPVPGGVGPMTIAMLMQNTLNLARAL